MKRLVLAYRGHSMELRQRETVVGRGLDCQIRYNDPYVSRRHARFRVNGEQVTVEDLGSRNGTLLNHEPTRGRSALNDGDVVQIGSRRLEFRIEQAEDGAEEDPFDEGTLTRFPPERPPRPVAGPISPDREQRCPHCRGPVGAIEELCGSCGQGWWDFRPGAVTQELPQMDPGTGRRGGRRGQVPVVYTSDNLTVETVGSNLSRTGAFVRTKALDLVGTRCEVTVMTDGTPPLTFGGRVSRVVEHGDDREPAGLAVEFVNVDADARQWLDDTIARLGILGRSLI